MNEDHHDGAAGDDPASDDAAEPAAAAPSTDDSVIDEPSTDAPLDTGADTATHTAADTVGHDTLDLDAVERDLADVETALERLDAGTYWTDEVTGDPIPDAALAANPVTRRADSGSTTS